MQINERIRNLRQDSDEKQEALASLLGITRQQYGLYETGKRQFKLEHIVTLCNHFEVSADYILGLPTGRPYGKSKTKR